MHGLRDRCMHTHSLTVVSLPVAKRTCPSNLCFRSSHSVFFVSKTPTHSSLILRVSLRIQSVVYCRFAHWALIFTQKQCTIYKQRIAFTSKCLLHKKEYERDIRRPQIQYCLHAMRFAYMLMFSQSTIKKIVYRYSLFRYTKRMDTVNYFADAASLHWNECVCGIKTNNGQ